METEHSKRNNKIGEPLWSQNLILEQLNRKSNQKVWNSRKSFVLTCGSSQEQYPDEVICSHTKVCFSLPLMDYSDSRSEFFNGFLIPRVCHKLFHLLSSSDPCFLRKETTSCLPSASLSSSSLPSFLVTVCSSVLISSFLYFRLPFHFVPFCLAALTLSVSRSSFALYPHTNKQTRQKRTKGQTTNKRRRERKKQTYMRSAQTRSVSRRLCSRI